MLPLLYLHGLSSGDFVPALEQFLGAGAGLSASTVTRLTATWQADYQTFATGTGEAQVVGFAVDEAAGQGVAGGRAAMSFVPRGEVWLIPVWVAWRSWRVWVAQHQVSAGAVSVIACSSRSTWATHSWWVADV